MAKIKFKLWILFLVLLIIAAICTAIFIENGLVREMSINVAGTTIFILLISIVFRKVMS